MGTRTESARLKLSHPSTGWICLLASWAFFLNSFSSPVHDKATAKPVALYRLRVNGEVENSLEMGLADLDKLAHKTVPVTEPNGKEVEFEGVQLYDVLRVAGATLGEKLRGDNLASYVLVRAADG